MGSSIRAFFTTGLLLGAPGLALAVFGPSAWHACAAAPGQVVAAVPAPASVASEQQPLTAWADTYNPTPTQLVALDAFFAQQRMQYMQTYQTQTTNAMAYVHAHYVGHRLATYLHLIYANQTRNNIGFTSYRRGLVNSLFQGGVVSSTPYTFRNIL